jgi:ribosomal protein S18 acetylase RimI-like enzyme
MEGSGAPERPRVSFRQCLPGDMPAVSDILYRTGLLGEDLTGTGLFNDRVLFRMVNVEGYLRWHRSHAFVAVDEARGAVVGYILGAPDTRAYDALFRRRMYWRLAARAFLVSWWLHPESFRHLWDWAFGYEDPAGPFVDRYPAHLHINVLPGWQRLGIGEGLIGMFECHMAGLGAAGIHLVTSNRNVKALPFYRRGGYDVLLEQPGRFWRGVDNHVSVVFGKRLAPASAPTCCAPASP